MTHFYTGTVLALVVPLCQYYLFSCFRNPGATRHVFIIFLLLSFCAAFQYCFVFYIPVFLIGLGQMQIFNWRLVPGGHSWCHHTLVDDFRIRYSRSFRRDVACL